MCLHPYTKVVVNPAGIKETVQFPCGHCIECLRDYQNAWKIRLSEEFAENPVGVFATLTYAPLNAPIAFDQETGELIETDEFVEYMETKDKRVLTLNHKDATDWIKRCRERYYRAKGERLEFKYFLCGEYGPRTLRPHYHLMIIGIKLWDFLEFFADDWRKRFGFIDASEIVYSRNSSPQRVANYVSKYCAKGEQFENPRVALGYCEKPRRTMSKGIGKNFALRIKEQIISKVNEYKVKKEDWKTKKDLKYLLEKHAVEGNDKLKYISYWYRIPEKHTYKVGDKTISYTESTYEKVWAYGFNADYLDMIIDKLNIKYFDYETQQTYTYKMPRYIRDVVTGTQSPLKHELQARLQERIETDRAQELEELQASHPDWTSAQTCHALVVKDYRERHRRAKDSTDALRKFYGKSQF